MIAPAEIKRKAERYYLPFLQSWLRGEAFQPISWPAGRPANDFAVLRLEIQALQVGEKSVQKAGYRLEYQASQTRTFGKQTLPIRIWLDTPEDLLEVVSKTEEWICFCQDVELLRAQVPELTDWVEKAPQKFIAQHTIWQELLLVCRYFRDHPRPGLYIRELPINVHTKFIEQHQGIVRELLDHVIPPTILGPREERFEQRYGLREDENQVRVRFLAGQLEERYRLPCDNLSLSCSHLARLDFSGQICLITENKMNFLTLPALENAIAIFGGGFQVGNLAALPWLAACPIVYWGDLDAHGFQILSQLRAIFPHVISLMMDQATFDAFSLFSVRSTPFRIQRLPNLTEAEHHLFLYLALTTTRLEQEHIRQPYALEQIHRCIKSLRLE